MALINPRVNSLYRRYSEQLIQEFSKRGSRVAVLVESQRCDNCGWDPIAKCSNGHYNGTGPQPFTTRQCPRCQGKGVLQTETHRQLVGNAKWVHQPGSELVPQPQGDKEAGYVKLKVLVKDHELLEKAAYFLIDGKRCSKFNLPHKRGLKDYVVSELTLKLDE